MTRISAARRRELLAQAALRVLSREGLGAVTTRAVVAEAGMSLASFHYAYASRDELLHELIGYVVAGEGEAAFLALLDQPAGEEPRDVRDAIRLALAAYLRLVTDDPGREQGMFELTQHALRTPGLDDLPRRQYLGYHELAGELLGVLTRRFDVDWDAPRDDLARFVVVLTDGITLAWLADRDDAAAERAIELATTALLGHVRSVAGAGR